MIDTIDIIEADVSTIGVGSAMGQAADVKSQAEKILQKGDE